MVAEHRHRPATAKPTRIAYSATAIATCVRAVIRMPTIAITSITRMTAVAMPIFGPVPAELEPKTARTDGARTTTPASDPMRLPVIISHPVRKPRYGLIARPTHSNDAPQLAFHMFSRRYAFAMISIGIAVSTMTGPLPYAVAAASVASVSPVDTAGADDAIPITVSCATPIASGSSRADGAGAVPAGATAE